MAIISTKVYAWPRGKHLSPCAHGRLSQRRCPGKGLFEVIQSESNRRGVIRERKNSFCEKHAQRLSRAPLPPVPNHEFATMQFAEWDALGTRLFGPDADRWLFVCPSCGLVQSRADFNKLKAPPPEINKVVGFSCIGRWSAGKVYEMLAGGQPCNYAGGGLFGLNPQKVVDPSDVVHAVFAFWEPR